MGEFYFGLACLWVVLIVVGFIFLGPSVRRLILLVREPFLLAFSTASSEAAYPEDAGAIGEIPDLAEHFEFYPAAWLLVQSRWHDDTGRSVSRTEVPDQAVAVE
jgi:hypothetical protein